MLQPGKMMEIVDEVLKLGTDLVALQEIRWQGHWEINKKNFTVIYILYQRIEQGSMGQDSLKWLGHVYRMQDTEIPKKMYGKLYATRRRGRPKMRWLDDVSTDLRKMGINEWIERPEDVL
jgi:hypothetical protein